LILWLQKRATGGQFGTNSVASIRQAT